MAKSSSGQGGCIPFVIGIIVLWALVFGVTWNGVHHGISCDSNKGVEVK